MLNIFSISIDFNAPITLTGSVAEINDPYTNARFKGKAVTNPVRPPK